MTQRHEILGREGGLEHVILILFRRPFGVYFTVRSPWWRDRAWRIRIGIGYSKCRQWFVHTRERCGICQEIVPADVDGHTCMA